MKAQSICIDNKAVVVSGRWVRMSSVKDEEWLEGEVVENPEMFISQLTDSGLDADIFTFGQKLPFTEPKYKYHFEWDNVAAIPTTSYKDWWEGLPKVTRKNIRRGYKHGVTAEVVEFDDELVNGIIGIHHDTPMRQGKLFAHYDKDFDQVKADYGTYMDKSDFLGAYLEGELIGIIKLVYIGNTAYTMQVLTKTRHYALKPTNILIAKAVEVCEKNNMSFLVYGKYIYKNITNSSLTEFKRLNGFEKIELPQYFIPLTLKGKVALKLKWHLGLPGVFPGVASFLRNLRAMYNRIKIMLIKPTVKLDSLNQNEEEKMMAGGE